MHELWSLLALALLPAAGNFTGGAVSELWCPSKRMLSLALHAASGILLAIVALELLDDAHEALSGLALGLAFVAGGVLYIGLEAIAGRVSRGRGHVEAGSGTRMWMIYGAVMIDLFSDGLMIGSGGAVSLSLALTLAAGQVLADLPEGFATAATLRANGIPRKRRLLLMASFTLPVLGAALLSYLLLRPAPNGVRLLALVVIAGMLTVAAIEDMVGEAHEAAEDSRRSVLAFTGGFALFAVVSAGLAPG